jgi:hypothetical protein
MNAKLGNAITNKVVAKIAGPWGVNAGLAALSYADRSLAPLLEAGQIRAQNVAADMAERAGGLRYPILNVYCEKIVNRLTEKFRAFSGSVHMAIEIRHSQDRLEQLQDKLEIYADTICQALSALRGDWGDGAFFGGEYEASFGQVKHGGKNYTQTAAIRFEIKVSRS